MCNLIDRIHSKSREEWLKLARQKLVEVRIWLQEHGELSLLIGVAAGVIVILAFPLVLSLIIMLALAAGAVWFIAPAEAPAAPAPQDNSEIPNDLKSDDGEL